jgi:hypothetical protein
LVKRGGWIPCLGRKCQVFSNILMVAPSIYLAKPERLC